MTHSILDNFANDDVLILSKELAGALGVSKSIILSHLTLCCHENERAAELKRHTHYHVEMWWMCKTLPEWEAKFDVLPQYIIEQNLRELEDLHLIYSTDEFNKFAPDRTKWYTINLVAFNAFMSCWQQHGCPIHDADESERPPDYVQFVRDWTENYIPQFQTFVEIWSSHKRQPESS